MKFILSIVLLFSITCQSHAKKHVKIATIGAASPHLNLNQEPQELVNQMIEFWQNELNRVLPDKPDLIVLPEACDRPAGMTQETQFRYFVVRGNQLMHYFRSVAKENHCYIAFGMKRQMEDGSWRNSCILLDREGNTTGIYNKNYPTIGEMDYGITAGDEAPLFQCDFGSVACAICFDLNFDELRERYAGQHPDIILFPSMYHGGMVQSNWAYSCRAYFVGSIGIGNLPSEIRNPLGKVIATSTNYFPYAVSTINLDYCLAHLDNNWTRLSNMKKKYGEEVIISDPGEIGAVLLTSEHETISIHEMVHEFGITLLDEYLDHSEKYRNKPGESDIVIENAEMRLVVGADASARSLIHKASGQECLMKGVEIPLFSITQYRPYDNEIQLAYPAKLKTFAADSVYKVGDDLVINFELIDYEAIVGMKITEDYIGFTLKKLEYHMADFGIKRKTRIDEFALLQLPVKERSHFGEWLNVTWDEDIAVNLLATNPYTRIDAEDMPGYKIFQAGGMGEVKIEGVGAALITTDKSKLLDRIDQVERDFGLPLGVESRRNEEYKNSYYELREVTPQNIDEHIAFAKKGGFRQMVIYYPDFAVSMGHFPWRSEYPRGLDDLKEITRKIEAAGMIPGFHIHYSKAQKNDPYVTPIPDPRLNLREIFTLRKNLGMEDTTIEIEENPTGLTLDEGRRILKIGSELLTYKNFTTTPPYQFRNCERGALNTTPVSRDIGDLVGLLDVDTWPIFVRFNQKTDIQEEVAERLAGIIKEAGFKFLYYDGAEDVPPPYWYHVSKAQLAVHEALESKPLFSEGALKSHFSWHILTRGNAFDTFSPEVIKEATRKHPLTEIELVSNDFTSIDFGWIGYVAPGEETIGMQPDMLEYVSSRAAAWNSVISLVGNLDHLKNHPRTADNLEVIRRWEEVRTTEFLSEDLKRDLKDPFQEHLLLINEEGAYELLPYSQISDTGQGNNGLRAFIFERNHMSWVVYWHMSGEGTVELPVNPEKIRLFTEPGKEMPVTVNNEHVILPVGNRRYLQFNLSQEEVIDLFAQANISK